MKTRIQAVMHRLFLVTGLGLLAIGPTLADVVDVTVNGSVSVSGSVTTYCLVPECMSPESGQFTTFPFSFSATNTQLGVFVASGGASSTGAPETDTASVQADVFENTTATADALEITLSQDIVSGGVAFSADATLNESIAVSFNLTEESKIQLTDNPDEGDESSTNSIELLDSTGNVMLVVPCGEFTCSTVSTVLQPGTYQLDDSIVVGGFLRGEFADFSSGVLNASFTPVVPEPRWSSPLLAALLGGYVMSRRRPSSAGEVD